MTQEPNDYNEEYEYYDMSAFENTVMKKLEVLEDKMDNLSGDVHDTQDRIKNIQFQFTRALIIRLIKWAVVIGFLYYLYANFAGPLITRAGDLFFRTETAINRADELSQESQSTLEWIRSVVSDFQAVPTDDTEQ